MDQRIASFVLSAASALALVALAAPAALAGTSPGAPASAVGKVDDVPAALRVPGDHKVVFEGIVAAGTQTYHCGADGKYVLLGPTAMLRGREGQYVAHYFGPSWQYQDGSVVVGKVIAKEPRANTIDQLLVQVSQHDGRQGLFSEVDFIQRLATEGGVPPPQCDPARDATLAVPYTAIYQFWAPTK